MTMISEAHEEKLATLETLLLQLYVQQFRNVAPRKIADETLADWEGIAAAVHKERPQVLGYIGEFYSEVRAALAHIRNKDV
jgi:hypothetical protein